MATAAPVRISAIVASPVAPNPGMVSVDLALLGLLRRYRIAADLELLQLYSEAQVRAALPAERQVPSARVGQATLPYAVLGERPEPLESSDVILYWGDFLHSRDYLKQLVPLVRCLGRAASDHAAHEYLYRYLFLADAGSDVLARTIVFGGTLLFNRERDHRDRVYRTRLQRLCAGAHGVWLRDIYSAQQVAQLRGRPNELSVGVDCALLVRDEDLELAPHTGAAAQLPQGACGVFFGRGSADPAPMLTFARDLCDQLGLRADWLPWFDRLALPHHWAAANREFPEMQFDARAQDWLAGDLLQRIGRYALVVTDTYHVCLNAWRRGVPAICIAELVPSSSGWNVNSGWPRAWRDKRQVFYAMHNAMEFFVASEELRDTQAYQRRLEHVLALVREAAGARAVARLVRQRSEAAETTLVGAIRSLAARRHGRTGRIAAHRLEDAHP